MPITIPTGSQEKSRHLLRALLREASYLPDNVLRTYLRRHIVARFREYPIRALKSSTENPSKSQLHHDRLVALHAQARKSLHFLQRANVGFRPNLLKLLLLAYGRVGRRRYSLLQPLRRKDGVPGPQSKLIDLSGRSNIPEGLESSLPRPNPMLEALLRSQVEQKPLELVGSRLKSLKLVMPMQNVWLRPLPIKRLVNLVEAWYKRLLDTALPPLPDSEWFDLQRMASGKTRWSGPRVRRTHCGTSLSWTRLEQDIHLASIQEKGGREKPHDITPRYMKRLYSMVFKTCPRMFWDEDRQVWNVQWGSEDKQRLLERQKNNLQLLQASSLQMPRVDRALNGANAQPEH